ncbi:TetR family transcriptional regulator [Rhizobium dioscoreae]|uniref:TetR/AcrR family transcriptional regulator n=1 Tax=Rhizobium TaxID=379 RepID=UPI000DDD573B|nr:MULTISPECIES: TetR/AcrR family transcriptional regulator [Rhizobium]MCZ3379630.1 TetR/AcrR family transcriptional regulator [Rhizobium sp. AG207R]GES42982.1 TetR family transcriptional regulator [Rhizobium dioscoreae]
MTQTHKRRADARTNRDRILAVARDALAIDPAASLHSIAKAAGVGQGTLYRHFPTRESLVLGIYRDSIDELVSFAPSLLEAFKPLEAFRRWAERFVDYGRKKQGVADMLRAAMTDQDFRETYWPMVDAVRLLMDACVDAGEVSKPVDAEDFLQLLALLTQLPPTAEGTARSERLLKLAFHGLERSEDH